MSKERLSRRALSWIFYAFARRRLHRARRNLRQARPQLPAQSQRRIVRRAYLEYRQHQLALPALIRMSSVALCARLSLHGWRELDRATASSAGRGVVFLGLVMGFFPLLQRVLELYCEPLIVVRGPLSVETESGRRILGHIAAGGHVLAPCGFPTMSESAAAIALAASAQTVPAVAFANAQSFHVELGAPLAISTDLADRYRSVLAREIDKHPESWPWHLAAPEVLAQRSEEA